MILSTLACKNLRQKLVCLVLFAAVAVGTTSCTPGAIKQAETNSSVYDRVIKAGKIRCAYVVYQPGCKKDPNTGKLSGIGIDTIELVAKNLGLKVEWAEEVGWGSMIEGLQTNRYDMVATPVWTNANRARIVDFSKPLFFSPIFAYVKSGTANAKIKDVSAFNSQAKSIGTIDGETAEIVAREDYPQARKTSLPQLSDQSQLFLTISTGKADVTFAEPASIADFHKTNPNALTTVGSEPVRIFPNCWMFRRGQMEFKNMIDTALEQLINSGVEEKILKTYEPAPNTLYRVARPYQTPAVSKN